MIKKEAQDILELLQEVDKVVVMLLVCAVTDYDHMDSRGNHHIRWRCVICGDNSSAKSSADIRHATDCEYARWRTVLGPKFLKLLGRLQAVATDQTERHRTRKAFDLELEDDQL